MDEVVVTQDMEVVPEKTLTQSQVNEIVKREKAVVADKMRREMELERTQEIEKLRAAQPSSMGGMQQENAADVEERVFKRILEMAQKQEQEEAEAQRQSDEAEYRQTMEQVAKTYHLKMGAGKEQFADFDEVMKDFDAGAFHQLAFLAAEMDNTAAIMYELSANPAKLASLQSLADKSPKMAQREMQKLSESIAKNQQAVQNNVTTNAPLSRLKSSNVGEDSGKMGLRDYKNADWLRG